MVLAFIRFVSDEISAAGREIKLAHELYPDSVVMSDSIGYVMVLLGIYWGIGNRALVLSERQLKGILITRIMSIMHSG